VWEEKGGVGEGEGDERVR
jgi:hypothetical protein